MTCTHCMPFGLAALHALSMRYTRSTLAMLAFVASVAVCATARAQNVPHPVALPLASVTQTLADAGVQVPPQVVLDAYSAYLDGYLPALAKADAGMRSLLAQMRATEDVVYGPRDAARFNEIERASMDDERRLAEALLDAVAAHAQGQDQACALARRLMALELLQTHLQNKGLGSRFNRLPSEIRELAQGLTGSFGGKLSAAELEAKLQKIAVALLDERLAATRAYAEACQTHRLEVAKRAEKLGLAGLTMDQSRNLVGHKAEEAREAAGTGRASADAANRVYAEYDLSGLYGGSVGPLSSHPACIAYLQVQLKACKQAFDPMSEDLKTWLARGWFGSLLGVDDRRGGPSELLLDGLPMPAGAPSAFFQGPPGYAYTLARIQDVTPEVHAKLVAVGDSWMNDDRQIIAQAMERTAATGIYEDVRQLRRDRAVRAVNEIADVLGVPEPRYESPMRMREFPKVTLGPDLPAEERARYGMSEPPASPRPAATSERARTWSFATSPLEYTPAVQADLCNMLRLTEDQQLLVATVFNDARERWAQQVEPLAAAGREVGYLMGEVNQEIQDEFNAKLNAAFAKSTASFDAALASDQALFDALRAALGPAADADALTVTQLSRRTLEAFGRDYDDSRRTDAAPLDVPRAVLEAQLSPAGRKAALAVVAASAKEWEALAVQRRQLIRQARLSVNTARRMSDAAAFDASKKARDELTAQKQKVDASWRALAEAACAQITAALAPEDATAWNTALLPLQWPKWYPVLRMDLPGPPELLATQRKRLRNAGDQIMSCLEDVRARQETRGMGDMITSSRLLFFENYISNLQAVVLEQIRAAAPPDASGAVPQTTLQSALDRYSSRVSAAATAPVP